MSTLGGFYLSHPSACDNSVAQSVGWSDVQQINDENCVSVESPLVSGGGPLSELSPSLLHEPDSG